MLKRIHLIQNIGKFADCHAAGCEFAKETIVFGFNTQGKSTLTAILRSLQTGNNGILIGRKTFGVTGSIKVEVDFDNNSTNEKCTFQNKAWDKTNPNIVIFDSKFISENIFEGENVTFDQQKNLNTIVIGKLGNDLSEEINKLQKESDDCENNKRIKSLEFSRHFSYLDFDSFNALKQDANIGKKLQDKEKEIKFEKEKEEIKALIKSHLQLIASIDFSIKGTLQKTLVVKQQEIEDHIKYHFTNEENARNFLDDGLSFLKTKPADGTRRSCVFCGQELGNEAETLIGLYSAFFKGGYEELQDKINRAIDSFNQINVEAFVTKIASDLKSRDLDIGLTDEKISELTGLKNRFESELVKKRDLNYTVIFTDFDNLKIAIDQFKEKLEDIQQQRLNVASPKSLIDLEKEKAVLDVTQKRFIPAWVTFCKDITDIDTKGKAARKLRDEKRKELETYSTSIFDTHKKTINEFCATLGADFEIEDFKPLKKIIGQDERIFAIKFFGSHKVTINDADEATPSFKNTLSESDKRLLAFAFFLSLLANDDKLSKKIIVFDDPMSSFDSERRRKSIQLITDIAYRYKEVDGTKKVDCPKQKIILTHEDRFAKELSRLMPNACTLKIEEYVDSGNKRSKVVHADFSKDFPDDEIIDKIEKIKQILDQRQFTAAFDTDCRIILENIFKRKYYFDLKELIVARKSIRSFVTKLKELATNGFDSDEKFNRFIRLCDDLCIELHDNGSSSTNGNKESILKDFFECLKNI
jgi:wobble nucleotide-excising tRNase